MILPLSGATTTVAIFAASLMGPAQVAARLFEFGVLKRLHPLVSTRLALLMHPLGAAVLGVVGAPDDEKGEVIVAFVVPQARVELDTEAIKQYCRSLLSSYKVPRHVRVIEELDLPKLPTGKADLSSLRDLFKSKEE